MAEHEYIIRDRDGVSVIDVVVDADETFDGVSCDGIQDIYIYTDTASELPATLRAVKWEQGRNAVFVHAADIVTTWLAMQRYIIA